MRAYKRRGYASHEALDRLPLCNIVERAAHSPTRFGTCLEPACPAIQFHLDTSNLHLPNEDASAITDPGSTGLFRLGTSDTSARAWYR